MLLLVAACKDDDPPHPCIQPELQKLSPTLRDYLFANGSVWIYENVSDGSRDTVTQVNILRTIYEHDEQGGTANMTGGCVLTYKEEFFTAMFTSSMNGPFQEGFARGNISHNDLEGTMLFLGEAQVGQTMYNATLEAFHDSLVVGNHTFPNVSQMYTRPQDDDLARRFYLSPGFGVIRTESVLFDSIYTAFELVDWQVTLYPYQ
ncbi:MAG TPA: hypothetical protein VHS96_04015 [Bacteroidia bacterium]|nr:hypothetical protein [Bacteroidia bacterium]